MRARVRTSAYCIEFEGPASLWNEIVRPLVGGPKAREEGATGHSAMATQTARATLATPAAPAASLRPTDPIHPTPSPSETEGALNRLASEGGRRAAKDAVLLAAWSDAGDTGETTPAAVARRLAAHPNFADVRVKPSVMKHVSRSHLLEIGTAPGYVRLTEKGRRYVRECVAAVARDGVTEQSETE